MLNDLLLNSTARHVLQVLPIALLPGILCLLLRRKKGLAGNLGREALLFFFTCYCTGLVCMILAPNNLWQNLWYFLLTGHRGGEIGPLFTFEFNFEPNIFYYLTGKYTGGSWIWFMYIANTAMFVPLGFFLPLVFRDIPRSGLLPAGLCVSVVMELLQPIVGRSFDTDDLICNTLGFLGGYFLSLLFLKTAKQK